MNCYGFLCLLLSPSCVQRTTTLVLFLLAAITDFLDGYLARRWEISSPFGAFLDPVADKVVNINHSFRCFRHHPCVVRVCQ